MVCLGGYWYGEVACWRGFALWFSNGADNRMLALRERGQLEAPLSPEGFEPTAEIKH